MKRLTVALLAAAISTPILAAEKPYVGIDYQLGTYTHKKTDVNPETLRLRAGTEINKSLAVEAQAAFGTGGDTYVATGNVKYDIKVDSFYSIFLKPQLQISKSITAYGLLGGTYIDVSASSAGKADDTGFTHTFSYGAGADFDIKNGIRLGADFIQYMDDYNAISVGIRIPIQ